LVFRNTVAQTAAYVSGYVFGFIIAPVMLARLGLAQFGIWAVTGAFATYAGLVDLGVTKSVERFVAFYHARDDERSVAECLGLGLLMITGVGILACGGAVLLAPLLAAGLDQAIPASELRLIMLASVGIFVLNAYRFVMSGVPIGMQRMVPPSVATVFYNVVSFALSLAALLVSRDLLTYAVANVVAAGIGTVAAAVSLRYAWRSARVRMPSMPLVREVLGYGVKSQVTWIADLVNLQADKVIIALVIDVRAAGAYEIANRAVGAVRMVASMSLSALLAAVTSSIAREGQSAVRRFYRHYALRSLSLALPLLIVTSALAPALLYAWLGEVPDDIVLLFIPLTLASAANISTGIATTIWLGEGKAGILAKFATGSAIANIALTLALTPLFGLWGVVTATVLTLVGTAVVILTAFHRTYPVPVADTLRAIGVPVGLSLVAALPVVAWLLTGIAPAEDRLSGLIATVALGLAFVAIYWPLATRLGILPDKLALRLPRRRVRASA
jgi:O-antigen/teichoic acid export membrane protein